MSVLIKGMEMPKHAGVNEDKDTVFRLNFENKEAEQALKERET